MNISQDGTTLSNKRKLGSDVFNYYLGNNPMDSKKLPDGGYLMPASVGIPGRLAFGLMRLNSMLDTVFVKFYTDTTERFESALVCAAMANGDFLIGGSTALNIAPNDSALIIRTDNNGNLKWRRSYKKIPNEYTSIITIDELESNKILVGATSTHWAFTSLDAYTYNTPWFLIIDSMGNILQDTLYTSLPLAGGGRIYKDLFGGYYHVGAFDSLYTQDPTDLINFPEYISHLNDDLEFDWIRSFGTSNGHKYIWKVQQLQDGNFQLSGANGDDTTWLQGWAARVDHNGWTIWDNNYLCDDMWSSYLVDFDVRTDGSLILIGAARNDTLPMWRGQEMWLVSVDANGCLIPGCAPTLIKDNTAVKGDIALYPNPTGDVLNISGPGNEPLNITIYSASGSKAGVYKSSTGSIAIKVQHLATGLYFCEARQGDMVVRRKFLKE